MQRILFLVCFLALIVSPTSESQESDVDVLPKFDNAPRYRTDMDHFPTGFGSKDDHRYRLRTENCPMYFTAKREAKNKGATGFVFPGDFKFKVPGDDIPRYFLQALCESIEPT